MYPGRITRSFSANRAAASTSHATFSGPYVSSVTSSVSGYGGWWIAVSSGAPTGRSS